MQRGLSTKWPWRVTAVLAVAMVLSCGTGIRDGEGDLYVRKTVGPAGGQLVLGEATVDVWQDCLASPTPITLRRYATIDHSGAVGPVFEIQVPTPDTFKNDPRIGITTSAVVADNSASKIGFLVPGVANEQWVPDSKPASPPCFPPVVCGPVQILEFTNPGGTNDPALTTTRLQFAIVTQCQSTGNCSASQACNSGACQECPTGALCNPPAP
jgi:hypothetical protein